MSAARPRLHWLSPLPPARTDIAHYTARILPELAAETDLILWTDAPRWEAGLHGLAPVRHLDPDTVTPRDLARAGRRGASPGTAPEAVFIHIGNAAAFHAGFARLAQRMPAVIVLHDLALQEMLFGAMRQGRFSRARYEATMRAWHGEAGVAAAAEVFAGARRESDLARDLPGAEQVLTRAVSVITHSAAADAALATLAPDLPRALLPLPFRPSDPAPEATRSAVGPLRLVQFGHTGTNRRLLAVLDALAGLRGEVDFHFDVMGRLWDPALVAARVAALGLTRQVTLHGFVPEEMLDATLARAHLVFNLRNPTMGEASGSQLRIWNAAAAGVVSDLGWYATLPAGTVFKIPAAPEGEAPALQALIRRLAADPDAGPAIGAAGRAHLEAHHGPALYARAVAEVAARFEAEAAARLDADRRRPALQIKDSAGTA